MKFRVLATIAAVLLAGAGATGYFMLGTHAQDASAAIDPRQEPPLVSLTKAAPVDSFEHSFTGIVAARVQSNLGFRISGKIVERLVNVGQDVKAGQPLMRMDDTDYRLVLTAKRNAVAAIQATVVQLGADEERYAALVKKGWSTRQRLEQAKAGLDAAKAQLAAAEAEVAVAENAVNYATLIADVDGTVIEAPSEPGQVVAAGQMVVQIAQAGPREAVVALPETLRPAIGSKAEAKIFGESDARYKAELRQLADSADPRTRTYEARYVLEGDAAKTPLGATVTIVFSSGTKQSDIQVPLAAVLDDGEKTGVWVLNSASSKVHFQPVKLLRVSSENAIIAGLDPRDQIVSLGAHLLSEGAVVRTAAESKAD